jgi:hypothetical protein
MANKPPHPLDAPSAGRTHRLAIVIIYSRKDRRWVELLLTHLKPLARVLSFEIWEDSRIKPGTKWRHEIEDALNNAVAAILMVSKNFMASDFVMNDEVPVLLRNAEERGTVIMPLIVAPSLFSKSVLSGFQPVNSPDEPLSKLSTYKRDEVLVRLATYIDTNFSR